MALLQQNPSSRLLCRFVVSPGWAGLFWVGYPNGVSNDLKAGYEDGLQGRLQNSG